MTELGMVNSKEFMLPDEAAFVLQVFSNQQSRITKSFDGANPGTRSNALQQSLLPLRDYL
jgi:hypothetical protein